ncbi:tyrosine-protein kinase Fer-like [Saccostrea cucullata]|uniref:tyrosine-protein kinase Fer-like n=1 Tax=Saccostrea cuccullata TaxID=36930 RepID=UPI002ED1A0E1
MASSLIFAQDVIRCSLCVNAVDYYCKTCDNKLCSECKSKHLSDKGKLHEVVAFNSDKSEIKRIGCFSHKRNNCEFFCRNCKIPVCLHCVVGNHRQHDFTELDDFLEEKRQGILEDIEEIETLLLPKIQHQQYIIHEEKSKNTIEVISTQEDIICKAVRDFGNKLREKVKQHKAEIQEKENKNASAEQNTLKVLHKAKSLLESREIKDVLEYSGIIPELRNVQPLDNCQPILDVKRFTEKDIGSLFGTLVIKKVSEETENENCDLGRKLEGESWFHGFIPQEEADRLLKQNGDFLVRVSKRKSGEECSYIISAFQERPVHIKIFRRGVYEKIGQKGTVVDFVNHLKTTGETCSSTVPVFLVNPIARERNHLKYDEILLDSTCEINLHKFPSFFYGLHNSKKVFIQKEKENLKDVFKDINFLRQFNHRNIVNIIGFSALREPVLLVIEYLSGGLLLHYLRMRGDSLNSRQKIKMCQDVANGMAYLHHNKCIHRDLGARNCLVGEDSTVKIFNFRMAEMGDQYESISAYFYASKWTPPESILSGKFTFFSDVWSFGILMWEIFSSGQIPYSDMKRWEAAGKVVEGYRMPPPPGTPKSSYEVMLKCWDKEPSNRYCFNAVVEKLTKIIKKVK